MSITIDSKKCIGCARCAAVCPGTLITLDEERKAIIRFPMDCWGCVSCVKECAAGAIHFYLAPDMGGNDFWMQVKKEGKYLDWDFYQGDSKIRTIRVDRTSSNQY